MANCFYTQNQKIQIHESNSTSNLHKLARTQQQETTMRNSQIDQSAFSDMYAEYVENHHHHHNQNLQQQHPHLHHQNETQNQTHDLFSSSSDWNLSPLFRPNNDMMGENHARKLTTNNDHHHHQDHNNNNNNNNSSSNNANHDQQQSQLSFTNLMPISCPDSLNNEIYYNNPTEPTNFHQSFDYNQHLTNSNTSTSATTIDHYSSIVMNEAQQHDSAAPESRDGHQVDLDQRNQCNYTSTDNQLVLLTNTHHATATDYHQQQTEQRSSRNSSSSSPPQTACAASQANNNNEYIYYDSHQLHSHQHNTSGAQIQFQDQHQNHYREQEQSSNNTNNNNIGMLENLNQFKYFENDNYASYNHHNQHLNQHEHHHHEQQQHTIHHYASNLVSSATASESTNKQQQQQNLHQIDNNLAKKSKTQKSRSRRGRPRKKGGHSKSKLWEFIRDLLLDDRTNPSFIRWERREDGVFKFVQSDKVAKMWGERKQNPKMTYEKLSRAMRYYYKSKVLLPVFGRRLVYKFGPNATGWLDPITVDNLI